MNLKQFMMYGQICPICSSNSMNMKMNLNKNQSYKYEGDNIVFMRAMTYNKNYIEYHIDKNTSKVKIEFYGSGKDKILLNDISLKKISNFKNLDKHTSPHFFSRTCANCKKYSYTSNNVSINYKTSLLEDLVIDQEYFGICKLAGSKYRIFRINNYYKKNKCEVICSLQDSAFYAEKDLYQYSSDQLIIKLPPIKFTTEHEVSNRINKLLPFA